MTIQPVLAIKEGSIAFLNTIRRHCMDQETYEKQKVFAGEKVPSMHRRMVGHDYQERQMYMITMVTEDRRPLLGQVVGRSDG